MSNEEYAEMFALCDEQKRRDDETANVRIRAVMAVADEAFRSAASRLLWGKRGLVRKHVLRLMDDPWDLNAIRPGLWQAHPRMILAVLKEEQRKIDRYVGFSGTVRPVNLRAAELLARYWRRYGEREQMLVAAE